MDSVAHLGTRWRVLREETQPPATLDVGHLKPSARVRRSLSPHAASSRETVTRTRPSLTAPLSNLTNISASNVPEEPTLVPETESPASKTDGVIGSDRSRISEFQL
jgi:hypothetical protein